MQVSILCTFKICLYSSSVAPVLKCECSILPWLCPYLETKGLKKRHGIDKCFTATRCVCRWTEKVDVSGFPCKHPDKHAINTNTATKIITGQTQDIFELLYVMPCCRPCERTKSKNNKKKYFKPITLNQSRGKQEIYSVATKFSHRWSQIVFLKGKFILLPVILYIPVFAVLLLFMNE